nr:putative integron gene cassette protein [uncultured bacterium]
MECNVNKIVYFFIASIWNIAILSVAFFLGGWLLDIVGSILESDSVRDYAYGVALLATISMFWFGLLSLILSFFVKCKQCGQRVLRLKRPFLVSPTNCRCKECHEISS